MSWLLTPQISHLALLCFIAHCYNALSFNQDLSYRPDTSRLTGNRLKKIFVMIQYTFPCSVQKRDEIRRKTQQKRRRYQLSLACFFAFRLVSSARCHRSRRRRGYVCSVLPYVGTHTTPTRPGLRLRDVRGGGGVRL